MRAADIPKPAIIAAGIAAILAVGLALEGGRSPTASWEGAWLGQAYRALLVHTTRGAGIIEDSTVTIEDPATDSTAKIDAYLMRAETYLGSDQWGMAERDLRAAFRLKPAGQQLEWYWMLQADIATFKNRDLEAAADYSKAAAATPDDPGARFIAQFCRGAAERRAANFASSISDYDAALSGEKAMTRLMPRILSSLDEKSRRRAQAQFDRATKIWRASLLRARAETWRAEARYDDALRDYTKAISLMPRDPKLFAGRGQTQFLRGDWRAGFADLLAATSLSFAGRPLRNDRTVACGP